MVTFHWGSVGKTNATGKPVKREILAMQDFNKIRRANEVSPRVHFRSYNHPHTNKKTIVIDVTNDRYIGKFIIWDDNSCFSELIEVDTEENILHERLDFNNINELKLAYKTFEQYYL